MYAKYKKKLLKRRFITTPLCFYFLKYMSREVWGRVGRVWKEKEENKNRGRVGRVGGYVKCF
jgi:hypothetical protein